VEKKQENASNDLSHIRGNEVIATVGKDPLRERKGTHKVREKKWEGEMFETVPSNPLWIKFAQH